MTWELVRGEGYVPVEEREGGGRVGGGGGGKGEGEMERGKDGLEREFNA